MRFVSYTYRGKEAWGAVAGDAVIDLSMLYPTLLDFIASKDFARRDELVAGRKANILLNDIKYLPVIPHPEKIILLVRNYLDHHHEVVAAGIARELSAFPPIFLRYARSQVGHGEPIIRPIVSEQLDYEGELAVVLGKGGRHIPESEAMSCVAGYSIYNDASVREYQFHAKQIAAGKNFDGTGAFGPWLTTPDDISDPNNLKLELRLNGVVMQSSNTGQMIFKIPAIINYASKIFELKAGDVLVTGTPAGVGWSRKPPAFMKDGDNVEVEISEIGILRNPVKNEQHP